MSSFAVISQTSISPCPPKEQLDTVQSCHLEALRLLDPVRFCSLPWIITPRPFIVHDLWILPLVHHFTDISL